ncbi:uncharacterized protein N7518_010305 [Penicillium psychrosexuale]|uniref:uncharacterized protein n=1 Tax=Penicillium psychrosexuale TaxID=1002107 RepID=UPI00254515B2|nr:uncharacterized protein N7518_010305 [Penicillium psychrosexuale]KAJ5781822.1 hypothetical protein N7518_010305 [Penicillium psychrosexuale]
MNSTDALARIRERASSPHIGEKTDSEYLQEVGTHFTVISMRTDTRVKIVSLLILNKNFLPKDINRSLREAFGKHSSHRAVPLRNREDALHRVRCLERENIKTPEFMQDFLPLYKDQGSLFWSGGVSISTEHICQNVLSSIFYANERGATADSIRRAFYCLALYQVIQRTIELHGAKTFTSKIASFCADMILGDSKNGNPQSKTDVVQQLRTDYKTGGVYEPYAQKAGYGIIFYLFVLPSKITEDVQTVLSHYESTGFQQEELSISAASSIMGDITNRFNSQISIFKHGLGTPDHSITPRIPQAPMRKRRKDLPNRTVSKKRRTADRTGPSCPVNLDSLPDPTINPTSSLQILDWQPIPNAYAFQPNCDNVQAISFDYQSAPDAVQGRQGHNLRADAGTLGVALETSGPDLETQTNMQKEYSSQVLNDIFGSTSGTPNVHQSFYSECNQGHVSQSASDLQAYAFLPMASDRMMENGL